MPDTDPDVVIVGAGVIGLAVAWRAGARGLSVVVLDRDAVPPTSGSSYAAAGLLAPVAEAEHDDELLDLGLESARRWPAFAAALLAATGVEPGYRDTGTLVVARDGAEAAWLDRELAFRERLGLDASRLLPGAARRLEPALGARLRAAVDAPGDRAVDPRALLVALYVAATHAGVRVREHTVARAVLVEGGRAVGVRLAGGATLHARCVVLAGGAWTGELLGIPSGARVPIHPRKAQTMRLHDLEHAARAPLLTRTIRYASGYVVPHGDGRYVLGATTEERGCDTTVTARGAHQLLHDAAALVPGVLDLVIEDFRAALRPSTPDDAPALGAHPALPGLHYATGHHRNAVLLAPITADLVAAGLDGEPAAHAFAPDRFAASLA